MIMKKKRVLPLIALGMMLMLGHNAVAQTAIERLKAEYPAVMEQYGKRLEAQKADYVIAIDVSGTMMQHKDLVLPALNSFIDALPEGDFLSIIKFGAKAEEFGLSGKVDKGSRDNFKTSLAKIYEKDPAFIYSTDLYAMSDAIMGQLSRPGSNDLKYVFMFTDFIDESSHPASEWEALSARVNAMSKTNTVRAFAMQLPGSSSGRDIQKERNVFPNLQTINVDNASKLNEWFEGQKADISKTRLKDLIRGDFDKWYSENNIKTELSIGLDHKLSLKYEVDGDVVPAFVNGLILSSCELVAQSNNIEKVEYAPDSVYKGRSVSAKIGSLAFFSSSLIQKNPKVTMAVTYRPLFTMAEKEGEASFANEIRNLELEDDLMRTEELTAERAFAFGWNIWLVCGLALLLLVFLYFFVKMTVLPYKLNNVKVVATTTSDGQSYTHQFNKEKSFLFGTKGIVLPQANFVLKVHGRRGFPIFVARSIAFSIVEKPQNVQLSFFKNNANIPSLSSTVKMDDTIRIQQGGVSYVFKLR